MSKLTIIAGDTNFQKSLTEREKQYIHEGDNWISKLSRECTLKSLHKLGYTYDEYERLDREKQHEVMNEASTTNVDSNITITKKRPV